jgi:hypothetical protein
MMSVLGRDEREKMVMDQSIRLVEEGRQDQAASGGREPSAACRPR